MGCANFAHRTNLEPPFGNHRLQNLGFKSLNKASTLLPAYIFTDVLVRGCPEEIIFKSQSVKSKKGM